MDADKAVLTSMLVTLTSTTAASAMPTKYGGRGELPSTRLLFGTGLTFFGLSVMADIAPSIAGPLAACVAITALTYYGFPLIDNVFNEAHSPVGTPPTENPSGNPTTGAVLP